MRHIEHDFVLRNVKNIHKCYRRLCYTEVRAHVASVIADTVKHTFTNFSGKDIELLNTKFADILRTINFL